MKRYRAVLFDFDYTLGDSTGPIVAGFRHTFAWMGWPEPEPEAVRRTIGQTLPEAYARLTGDRDPERGREFQRGFRSFSEERIVADTVLFPGAAELLRGLKAAGIAAGVVSTKPTETLRRIFQRQGLLPVLDVIVGGDLAAHSKPAPDSLLLALERLGVGREQTLYCGDTVIDAETAHRAGTDFCPVLNGTTPERAFDPWPHVSVARDLPGLHRALGL